MVENQYASEAQAILSCISRDNDGQDDAYWRMSLPCCCDAENVIEIYEKLISDGLIAVAQTCCLTKKGRQRLRELDDLEFEESENDLAENEKKAFDACLRTVDGASINKETAIYRYMCLGNFYRMLDDGENALAHLSKWEDPFEGYVFKGKTLGLGKEFVDLHRIFSTYYGQCWTLDGDETDMRWRACGARGTLVRIESTVGQLFESLKRIEPKNRLHVAFKMGKVEYKPENELINLVQGKSIGEFLHDKGDTRPLDILFIKRKEFESEDEFRIIIDVSAYRDYRNGTNLNFKNGMAIYKVPIESIVTSVLADPCMPSGDFDHLQCRMAIHNSKSRINLAKSNLFNWPNFKMTI